LRESKITKFERCMKQIGEMSLHQKFQCRLDHESALYLRERGHRLNTRRSSRGMVISYSIPDLLKVDLSWARFYIETPFSIWDDMIDDRDYRRWLEVAVCEDGDYRRPSWHQRVSF
jgi:hypothetical protein